MFSEPCYNGRRMPRVAAVGTALPSHLLSQDQAYKRCQTVYGGDEALLRLLRVFHKAGVEQRYFAFPPEYYQESKSFDKRNADYIEQGTELAARAAKDCLARASTRPEQVDHLILVTTTGLATPSLDALLARRLGLKRDVRRTPIFGVGCAGGAVALSRACEHVRAYPKHRALAVAVELCGQVFSPAALRPVDVVGAALFGDGAACALVAGDEIPGPGPRALASKSVLFEGTERVMGWTFTSDGMRLELSQEVEGVIEGALKEAVLQLVTGMAMQMSKIVYWILHPGGRKVLESYARAFALGERPLEWSRNSLARVGNLSSASVLFILGDVLGSGRPHPGDKGLIVGLGPGFAAELVLLGW